MTPHENNLKDILKANNTDLTESEIISFLAICEFKKVKNKEVVIEAYKKSTIAFFILKGTIKGYLINKKGVEKNIFLRPKNTLMGAPNALFNKDVSKYTFEAIGDTELIVFEFKALEDLALKNTGILKFYLAAYKEMIQTLIYRVESMINKMTEQRYEDLLKVSSEFFKTVYHKDIANYLGITPVSLSRIIKRRQKKDNS